VDGRRRPVPPLVDDDWSAARNSSCLRRHHEARSAIGVASPSGKEEEMQTKLLAAIGSGAVIASALIVGVTNDPGQAVAGSGNGVANTFIQPTTSSHDASLRGGSIAMICASVISEMAPMTRGGS